MYQTEFPFTLPHGYIDSEGCLHREGVMRLSRATDEITPLRDPRVQKNSGYSGDLAYLQDFYQRINRNGHTRFRVACPHCNGEFEVETASVGE